MLGQSDHQAHAVFSHGGVIHAGGEKHRDFQIGGSLHIDTVQADPIFADGLESRQGRFDDFAGDGVITVEQAIDAAVSGDQTEHFVFG